MSEKVKADEAARLQTEADEKAILANKKTIEAERLQKEAEEKAEN